MQSSRMSHALHRTPNAIRTASSIYCSTTYRLVTFQIGQRNLLMCGLNAISATKTSNYPNQTRSVFGFASSNADGSGNSSTSAGNPNSNDNSNTASDQRMDAGNNGGDNHDGSKHNDTGGGTNDTGGGTTGGATNGESSGVATSSVSAPATGYSDTIASSDAESNNKANDKKATDISSNMMSKLFVPIMGLGSKVTSDNKGKPTTDKKANHDDSKLPANDNTNRDATNDSVDTESQLQTALSNKDAELSLWAKIAKLAPKTVSKALTSSSNDGDGDSKSNDKDESLSLTDTVMYSVLGALGVEKNTISKLMNLRNVETFRDLIMLMYGKASYSEGLSMMQDEDLNPELKRDAHVRISKEVSEREQIFVDKRRENAAKALSKFLEMDVDVEDVVTIGIAGSGGGCRALVCTLAYVNCLKDLGLLPAVTWMSGVSGSTWAMAHMYNSKGDFNKVWTELEKPIAQGYVSLPYLADAIKDDSVRSVLMQGVLERIQLDRELSTVDIFAMFLSARFIDKKLSDDIQTFASAAATKKRRNSTSLSPDSTTRNSVSRNGSPEFIDAHSVVSDDERDAFNGIFSSLKSAFLQHLESSQDSLDVLLPGRQNSDTQSVKSLVPKEKDNSSETYKLHQAWVGHKLSRQRYVVEDFKNNILPLPIYTAVCKIKTSKNSIAPQLNDSKDNIPESSTKEDTKESNTEKKAKGTFSPGTPLAETVGIYSKLNAFFTKGKENKKQDDELNLMKGTKEMLVSEKKANSKDTTKAHDKAISKEKAKIDEDYLNEPRPALMAYEGYYQWWEFTPYESGYRDRFLNRFVTVPTWSFGRKFNNGVSMERIPEQGLGTMLATFGSAFTASIAHIYEEVKMTLPSTTRKLVLKVVEGYLDIHLISPVAFKNISYKLPLYEAALSNEPVKIGGSVDARGKEVVKPIAEADVSVDEASKARLASTVSNADSIDALVPEEVRLMDSGMDNNIPLEPLISRDADVVLVFDSSQLPYEHLLRVILDQKGEPGYNCPYPANSTGPGRQNRLTPEEEEKVLSHDLDTVRKLMKVGSSEDDKNSSRHQSTSNESVQNNDGSPQDPTSLGDNEKLEMKDSPSNKDMIPLPIRDQTILYYPLAERTVDISSEMAEALLADGSLRPEVLPRKDERHSRFSSVSIPGGLPRWSIDDAKESVSNSLQAVADKVSLSTDKGDDDSGENTMKSSSKIIKDENRQMEEPEVMEGGVSLSSIISNDVKINIQATEEKVGDIQEASGSEASGNDIDDFDYSEANYGENKGYVRVKFDPLKESFCSTVNFSYTAPEMKLLKRYAFANLVGYDASDSDPNKDGLNDVLSEDEMTSNADLIKAGGPGVERLKETLRKAIERKRSCRLAGKSKQP